MKGFNKRYYDFINGLRGLFGFVKRLYDFIFGSYGFFGFVKREININGLKNFEFL